MACFFVERVSSCLKARLCSHPSVCRDVSSWRSKLPHREGQQAALAPRLLSGSHFSHSLSLAPFFNSLRHVPCEFLSTGAPPRLASPSRWGRRAACLPKFDTSRSRSLSLPLVFFLSRRLASSNFAPLPRAGERAPPPCSHRRPSPRGLFLVTAPSPARRPATSRPSTASPSPPSPRCDATPCTAVEYGCAISHEHRPRRRGDTRGASAPAPC
jgi:hypothetical protein